MEDRERIEAHCSQHGLKIDGWKEDDENGLTAQLGRWEVVTDEYDDDGLYAGDEGNLTASVVGGAKYGNQRVHVGFTPDESDGAIEVHDISALDPIV
jgi:hypothetical protein